jgi:PEP-CTERM motif
MRVKSLLMLALGVSWTAMVEKPALAGYTITTNADVVSNHDIGPFGTSVGDSFSIKQGTFALFVPDSPMDVQIGPALLANLGYTVTGTVTGLAGTTASYSGTYEIFLNTDGNHTLNPGDLRVSSGTYTATALNIPFSAFNGHLTQLLGPQNPGLPDLSNGGHDINLVGYYLSIPFVTSEGMMQTVFAQNAAAVPEPDSMVILALGTVGFCLCARRRKR